MKSYSVTMEFTGHHEIEVQPETDEDAIRMVEDGELYHKDKKEVHESEECIPIVETIRIKNEDKGVRYI